MILKIIFWVCLGIIVYSYIGYTLLLIILNIFVSIFKKKETKTSKSVPEICLLIASYNEIDSIDLKIANIDAIDYPTDKLKVIWITDGSDDGSYEKLMESGKHTVIHQKKREGKTKAINRGMKFVDSPFVIFTDANTLINSNAIRNIVKEFDDKIVGCVSGEKRIRIRRADNAVASGEGIYWRYESLIKKLESSIGSTIASAGELFGIRTELFDPIPEGIINDDFHISLQIVKKGYRIKYCPGSYAIEKPSLNIQEEKLRKIRIAAGGIQALSESVTLLNPFRYCFFSLQFFSHKVLRWLFVPFSFVLVLLSNILISATSYPEPNIYLYLLMIQVFLWLMIIPGFLLQGKNIRLKILFIPYYLYLINISGIIGIFRYAFGKQEVIWKKAKRMI